MTKQALRELRDKVAAGERGDGLNTSSVFGDNNGPALLAVEAFDGSVDAAIELLEAVLPDWVYVVCNDSPYDQEKCLCAVFERSDDPAKAYEAETDTPARALLLATLDALIARAE